MISLSELQLVLTWVSILCQIHACPLKLLGWNEGTFYTCMGSQLQAEWMLPQTLPFILCWHLSSHFNHCACPTYTLTFGNWFFSAPGFFGIFILWDVRLQSQMHGSVLHWLNASDQIKNLHSTHTMTPMEIKKLGTTGARLIKFAKVRSLIRQTMVEVKASSSYSLKQLSVAIQTGHTHSILSSFKGDSYNSFSSVIPFMLYVNYEYFIFLL